MLSTSSDREPLHAIAALASTMPKQSFPRVRDTDRRSSVIPGSLRDPGDQRVELVRAVTDAKRIGAEGHRHTARLVREPGRGGCRAVVAAITLGAGNLVHQEAR